MAALDCERGSLCGSIGGETYASSRRKKDTCTLRSHSVAMLAKQLKEDSLNDDPTLNYDNRFSIGNYSYESNRLTENRFNKSFHNYRFLVVMFGGLAVGLMLLLRYNITVAILNMVNQTAIYMEEHPNKTMEDFYNEGYSSSGEFDWDNEIQQMIMSWYMIAYTLPQMPCTKLGLLVGSRWSVAISLTICAISTLLTPACAYLGWQYVIWLRLVNGIGASAVLPMMLNLVENWMPYDEITLGLTCSQLFQSFVSAANPLVAGYLSSIHWSYAFYVPGVATLAFCILWLILITNHPDENFFVSQHEVGIICGCPKDHTHNHCTGAENEDKSNAKKKDPKNGLDVEMTQPEYQPTWLDVFRVPSFYAYTFMWCFYCSPYSLFTFIMPTYLRQFLKISVAENGFYCSLITCGQLLAVLWPHPFLRFLQNKVKFSTTASRRFTYLIVCSMCGLSWFYVGTFHANQLVFLFLNRSFHGSTDIVVTGNLLANFAKVNLSSLAFSMVNTVGNLSVVFASTFCGYVLDYTGSSEEGWTYIFWALASTQLVTLFIFSTFIRAEPVKFERKGSDKKFNKNDRSIDIIVAQKNNSDSKLKNNFGPEKEVC